MPNRYIRAAAIESEMVNSLSWQGEVFYRRLLNRVDDFGRFTANLDLLRASIFPLQITKVSVSDTARLLKECEDAGLVFGYEVNGKRCLVMNKWEKGRALHSEYPEPPPDVIKRMQTYVFKCKHMSPTPTPTPITDSDPVSGTRGGLVFPESSQEAVKQCALEALPPEFVVSCYDKAASRGGLDAKSIPIADFRAYCRTEWKYERERRFKEGPPSAVKKPSEQEMLRHAQS